MKHEDFMKFIRKYNQNVLDIENESSQGARIRKKIMQGGYSDKEWLALQEELREFIASNPPKDEMEQLQGFGEALSMICCGIKKKQGEKGCP